MEGKIIISCHSVHWACWEHLSKDNNVNIYPLKKVFVHKFKFFTSMPKIGPKPLLTLGHMGPPPPIKKQGFCMLEMIKKIGP